MEKETPAYFNSPIIQRNTPIKRLGLSRKRKSCGSDGHLLNKIHASNEKYPSSPVQTSEEQIQETNKKGKETDEVEQSGVRQECDKENTTNENCTDVIDYDKEIELIKQIIKTKEEKLKSLQNSNSNISDLENLLELWKNGCKNAFLHFRQLLKERQMEEISCENICKKLGIWETMLANFESDSDICLSDSSQ